MSGDDDQVDAVDLNARTDDQREGLACINCGRSGGPMRPILTPDNPQSTMVFFHSDTGLCVRYISRYITGLHMRMVSIAEDERAFRVWGRRPQAALEIVGKVLTNVGSRQSDQDSFEQIGRS